MNWTYLRVEALLPLAIGLGMTLLACALFALRLHAGGGSSQVARRKFLRFAAWTFPVAFLLACLWDGRASLAGMVRAWRGNPSDQYIFGLLRRSGQGFLARDPAKAAAWFRRAADQGMPDAQVALARSLLTGDGVPKDPAESLRLAEAAAGAGSLDAQLLCGDLLRGPDPNRAAGFYRDALSRVQPAAGRGEPGAMVTLGCMYLRGQGLPRDPVTGYAWLLAAARRGLSPMQRAGVVMEGGALTKDQRIEAARRAQELGPVSRP